MDRVKELQRLKEEMVNDLSLPLLGAGQNLVFGEGDPNAKILMIGEGPGFWENKLGRPFVGEAGKLLDEVLNFAGLRREEIYITNVVKFRPPNNRDPTEEEIKAFKPYLDRQIQIIDPKIIATLGRFAMGQFLPHLTISTAHGKVFQWQDKIIFPLFHPAAALRRREIEEKLRQDILKLREVQEGILKPKQEELLRMW